MKSKVESKREVFLATGCLRVRFSSVMPDKDDTWTKAFKHLEEANFRF